MREKKRSMRTRLTSIFFTGALMCLLVAGAASAEEQEGANSPTGKIAELDMQAGATIDLYGQYIWRGQTLVDDPVFQPGAYIGVGAFTASIWGNYTLTDGKEWTEIDYILDYTRSLGFAGPRFEAVSVSLGYIYYDFPNLHAGDDSQEIYAAIAVDTFLAPSFAVYHDYDQGDGTYYEFAVSHSLPVDKLSLNLSAAVGYNDTQWDFKSSFSSALFGASLTVPLTERVSFEPGVFYSAALDSQYDDEFFGGFSISIQFGD